VVVLVPADRGPADRGLVSFYNEKVDIRLDGQPTDRPATPFSR
jgi:hypothetical protein